MRKIERIIIHCSATPYGKNVSAKDIDRYHKSLGWAGIGYHYVICFDGSVHIGRPVAQVGAHCKGFNQTSIGICYIGGLDADGKPADTRTEAQIAALISLVRELKAAYPSATVHGHNEFCNKACPCFNVQTSELCVL